MVDFIKSLGKIQVNGIGVMAAQEVLQDGINVFQQLREAATAFQEAMLVFAQQVVVFQVVYYNFPDYSFKGFYNVGGQGNGSVVSSF